jgi:hypothetical protein
MNPHPDPHLHPDPHPHWRFFPGSASAFFRCGSATLLTTLQPFSVFFPFCPPGMIITCSRSSYKTMHIVPVRCAGNGWRRTTPLTRRMICRHPFCSLTVPPPPSHPTRGSRSDQTSNGNGPVGFFRFLVYHPYEASKAIYKGCQLFSSIFRSFEAHL